MLVVVVAFRYRIVVSEFILRIEGPRIVGCQSQL